MLKINLLPAYIYERRKVRGMMVLFGLIFAVTVASVAGWFVFLTGKQNDLNDQVIIMEANAAKVKRVEDQIQAEKAAIAGTKAKTDYIEAVMKYNLEYVKLYDNLSRYTYSRILYKSVTPSGSQLTINAHARTLGDCGRYLLNMYRATSIFSSVTINGVPGWQTSGNTGDGFDFTVSCTLVNTPQPPVYGGGGGSTSSTTGGSTPPSGTGINP